MRRCFPAIVRPIDLLSISGAACYNTAGVTRHASEPLYHQEGESACLAGEARLFHAPTDMAAALTLYRSTIGKKVVMALTGLVLVGFVVAHMLGNLKVFQG